MGKNCFQKTSLETEFKLDFLELKNARCNVGLASPRYPSFDHWSLDAYKPE